LRLKPAADGRACKRGCQTCLTLLTPRILLNDRSAARSWDLEEISGVRLLHLDFLRPLLSQSESEMFVRSDLRSENRRVEVATFWIGAQGILVEIRSGCQERCSRPGSREPSSTEQANRMGVGAHPARGELSRFDNSQNVKMNCWIKPARRTCVREKDEERVCARKTGRVEVATITQHPCSTPVQKFKSSKFNRSSADARSNRSSRSIALLRSKANASSIFQSSRFKVAN
jgi:hypothetical protein